MGGRNLDQFEARQKSKAQKDAKTGTTSTKNVNEDKKKS